MSSKDLSFVDSRSLGPPLVPVDQFGMVDTHGVKDRGVDVVDMEPVFDGMKAEVIRLAGQRKGAFSRGSPDAAGSRGGSP